MRKPKPVSLKKKTNSALDGYFAALLLKVMVPAAFILIGIFYVIEVYRPFNMDALHSSTTIIFFVVFWVLALTLLLTRRLMFGIIRPIKRIAKDLRKIDPLNPKKSLMTVPAEHAKTEIGEVILAGNHLLNSLEQHRMREIQQFELMREREELLGLIFNTMQDGFVCLGPDYRVIRANRIASHLLGYDETGLVGVDFVKLFSYTDQPRLTSRLSLLSQSDSGDNPLNFEANLSKTNKNIGKVNMTLSRLSGAHRAYVIAFRDVADTRSAQEKLRENERRLQLAITATRCGVWDYQPKSEAFWCSPELLSMLGYAEGEVKPSAAFKNGLIHPEDSEWVQATQQRYLLRESQTYNPEYRISKKDGSYIWVVEYATAEWDTEGNVVRFTGALTDCTERKRFESQMMYMATHDPLTNLPNRTLLNDRLTHAINGNQRAGLMVGVLLLDIDRFKLINDSLGHEIGDQLIKAVAERLQQNIRPTDTLSRLSGDEFVVICEGLSSPQEVARVAKRLLNAMSQHFMVDGNQLNIGMSAGISLSPTDGTSAQDILRHADTAMHSAKSAGGSCYRYFVAEMNKQAVQRLNMERQINEALERQQFILHYQPKVDIQTLEVVGAEALIRWPQLGRETISPMQFIPVAEETGQVQAIGEWVLREALSQIASWREHGYEPPPIAINLSGKQLMSGGVDELIIRLLREYNVPPQLLEIEITESSFITRMDKVLPPLQHLRDTGLGIALDDFGTGYSSLAYLRQIPITTLKIDRSFVKDIGEKKEATALASIILEIGRQLGLKVVAEGIETQKQLDFMRERRCDYGQGWMFHKALSAQKFQALLKKKV